MNFKKQISNHISVSLSSARRWSRAQKRKEKILKILKQNEIKSI